MNIRRTNSQNDLCTHAQYFAHAHALKCLFVNARGLVGKIDILKMQIYEMEIDIIRLRKSILKDILCIEKIGVILKKEEQVVSFYT